MNSWENLKSRDPNDIPAIKNWKQLWRICVDFHHPTIFDIPENCEKNANLAAWEKFFEHEIGSFPHLIFTNSSITFNTSCTTYFPELFKSISAILIDIYSGSANEDDVKNTECLLTLNDNSKDADHNNILSYFPELAKVGLFGGNPSELINEDRYFKGSLICGNMVDEWSLTASEANRINEMDEYRRLTGKDRLIGRKTVAPNNRQSSTAQAAYYTEFITTTSIAAIFGVLLLIAIVFIVVLLICRRRKNKQTPPGANVETVEMRRRNEPCQPRSAAASVTEQSEEVQEARQDL